MIKACFALLLLPLAMAGCSQSDDDDDGETPVTDSSSAVTPDDPDGSTYQITFFNRSGVQSMTPPIVAIHDPAVNIFTVGETVSAEVRAIAENGETGDLRNQLTGLVTNGVASTGSPVNNDGTQELLLPGRAATMTLSADSPTQVLSFVSMIVCTNDGFTGFDSRALSAGVEMSAAQNYDAGSEVNTASADYWVSNCNGGESNLHEDQNGVIAVHEGQQPLGTDARYAFPMGEVMMEVQITRN